LLGVCKSDIDTSTTNCPGVVDLNVSSSAEERARLEALMRENLEPKILSEAEERLTALRANLEERSEVLGSPTLGSASEDFVQMSIPGHPGKWVWSVDKNQ
jgi:hypothetical protein